MCIHLRIIATYMVNERTIYDLRNENDAAFLKCSLFGLLCESFLMGIGGNKVNENIYF